MVLLAGGALGTTLWRLYAQPPLFAYDHLWGYFAGPLYDELVQVSGPLLAFRASTLARIALLAGWLSIWQARPRVGAARAPSCYDGTARDPDPMYRERAHVLSGPRSALVPNGRRSVKRSSR